MGFVVLLLVIGPSIGAERVPIPAGRYRQGAGRGPDDTPREVSLSAFQIASTEVSIAEFERFATSGYQDPRWWSEQGRAWLADNPGGAGAPARAAGRPADHPVVAVSWYEADAYCRSVGGSLPSEAQWERACSGGEGRLYPWGEQPSEDARVYTEGKLGHLSSVRTDPVGAQAVALRSLEGLAHLSGNVWEWTADGYQRDWEPSPPPDPGGPLSSSYRVMRGGSYMNLPSYATCTHREPARPERVSFTVGFRCVWAAP